MVVGVAALRIWGPLLLHKKWDHRMAGCSRACTRGVIIWEAKASTHNNEIMLLSECSTNICQPDCWSISAMFVAALKLLYTFAYDSRLCQSHKQGC